MRKNQKEIAKLLTLIANGIAGERITDKSGNLDVDAFNKQSIVKKIVEQLKSLGVKSNNDLADRGFMAAAMVLKIK